MTDRKSIGALSRSTPSSIAKKTFKPSEERPAIGVVYFKHLKRIAKLADIVQVNWTDELGAQGTSSGRIVGITRTEVFIDWTIKTIEHEEVSKIPFSDVVDIFHFK
jgi:hypothetical protein